MSLYQIFHVSVQRYPGFQACRTYLKNWLDIHRPDVSCENMLFLRVPEMRLN